MEYLIPVIVLCFLIFIHELGHFLGAKFVGVKVEEFSIGFPPRLFSKTWNGTKYCLSLILLGGYVRLKGQNLDDENFTEKDNYASKTVGQRFIILISGPLMNLFFAIIILPLSFMIPNSSSFVMEQVPVIESTVKNGIADKAGIKAYDQIIAINDKSVNNWNELYEILQSELIDRDVKFNVLRNGEMIEVLISNTDILENQFGWDIHIPAIVGKIKPKSPAAMAQLKTGDVIIAANDTKIKSFQQIQDFIQTNQNTPFILKVRRNNQLVEMNLKPDYNVGTNRWYIGFHLPQIYKSYGFIESCQLGFEKIQFFTVELFKFFKRLVTGKVTTHEVGGPISIFKILADSNERGLSYLLFLAAFISFQLALFNLLPIPALDGGHIFLLFIEKIYGKNLDINLRKKIQTTGSLLLIGLMIFVLFIDTTRFF